MPTSTGTGFFISVHGYVLTASHALACDPAEGERFRRKGRPRGRIGSVFTNPVHVFDLIAKGPPADIAVLKIHGAPADHHFLTAYSAPGLPMNTAFDAWGFPKSLDIQPVPGRLGNANAPGGRRAAAATFLPAG